MHEPFGQYSALVRVEATTRKLLLDRAKKLYAGYRAFFLLQSSTCRQSLRQSVTQHIKVRGSDNMMLQ